MNDQNQEQKLSTDHQRFRKGDRVICWGNRAVVTGIYKNHANIACLKFEDESTTTIITHFVKGELNEHIHLEKA